MITRQELSAQHATILGFIIVLTWVHEFFFYTKIQTNDSTDLKKIIKLAWIGISSKKSAFTSQDAELHSVGKRINFELV